jgi:hypothetical protein
MSELKYQAMVKNFTDHRGRPAPAHTFFGNSVKESLASESGSKAMKSAIDQHLSKYQDYLDNGKFRDPSLGGSSGLQVYADSQLETNASESTSTGLVTIIVESRRDGAEEEEKEGDHSELRTEWDYDPSATDGDDKGLRLTYASASPRPIEAGGDGPTASERWRCFKGRTCYWSETSSGLKRVDTMTQSVATEDAPGSPDGRSAATRE